jgi:hypothetical protein
LLSFALLGNAAFAGDREFCVFSAKNGLYKIDSGKKAEQVLSGQEIKKIVRTKAAWYTLGSEGVQYSLDLRKFEKRNTGIPVKTIKNFVDGKKALTKELADLKDLEVDPYNPNNLITCTKDRVYYTKDAGLTWLSVQSPVPLIGGISAVAICSAPRLTLYASHPIKGLWSFAVDEKTTAWAPFSNGLDLIPGTTSVEEISDIQIKADGLDPKIYAAASFNGKIYVYQSNVKVFKAIYNAPTQGFSSIGSIDVNSGVVNFISDAGISVIGLNGEKIATPAKSLSAIAMNARKEIGDILYGSYIPSVEGEQGVSLSELWLLDKNQYSAYAQKAVGKNGIYLQTGFVKNKLEKYQQKIKTSNLNMLVIDMKDDEGHLRFIPKDPEIRLMGQPASPIDVEAFVSSMKSQGVYLVARIVVFKDKALYHYSGNKYAVWDKASDAAWQGNKLVKKEEPAATAVATEASPIGSVPSATPAAEQYVKAPIPEYWVDPYCEYVWKYNVDVAKEIIARGFDEVQFDYIRFPTDGVNLRDAQYRYQDPGMDQESALMSFLSYARANISAPISVDIYGANGWYRTGVRTGQDVELLSKYVDVICPMLYPSHFEQDFYAQKPEAERPYRIYYYGTNRNSVIARRKTVIRPWVQAFYMNVKYDRAYYNLDYVKNEVRGVTDSGNEGMTFWNNIGRYDDIPSYPKVAVPATNSINSLLN